MSLKGGGGHIPKFDGPPTQTDHNLLASELLWLGRGSANHMVKLADPPLGACTAAVCAGLYCAACAKLTARNAIDGNLNFIVQQGFTAQVWPAGVTLGACSLSSPQRGALEKPRPTAWEDKQQASHTSPEGARWGPSHPAQRAPSGLWRWLASRGPRPLAWAFAGRPVGALRIPRTPECVAPRQNTRPRPRNWSIRMMLRRRSVLPGGCFFWQCGKTLGAI
jgi:hypothetical protein